MFQHLKVDEYMQLPEPHGWQKCSHVGFSGRTAIYEIVPVDDSMRRLIHGNAAEFELENHARRHAVRFVRWFKKVLAGKTTLEVCV